MFCNKTSKKKRYVMEKMGEGELTHGLKNHIIIILYLIWIHWLQERPSRLMVL